MVSRILEGFSNAGKDTTDNLNIPQESLCYVIIIQMSPQPIADEKI